MLSYQDSTSHQRLLSRLASWFKLCNSVSNSVRIASGDRESIGDESRDGDRDGDVVLGLIVRLKNVWFGVTKAHGEMIVNRRSGIIGSRSVAGMSCAVRCAFRKKWICGGQYRIPPR